MSFADSLIVKLIPEPFRVFLPYVSPSGLAVVHKEAALKLVSRVAQDRFSADAKTQTIASLRRLLGASVYGNRIEIVDSLSTPLEVDRLSPGVRVEVGTRILALYFLMAMRSPVICLDLRTTQFAWDEARSVLLYAPSSLFFRPSAEFSERVRALYDGFYRDDGAQASRGAGLYAWKCSPDEGYLSRVEVLLRKHFGSAKEERVSFSIEHFKASFHAIFEEARRSHAKFHPELSLLGLSLVTLYLALEKLGSDYDVHAIYAEASL